MKKLILITMLLLITLQVQAYTGQQYIDAKQYLGSGSKLLDPLYLYINETTAELGGTELGTGSTFFVDSSISGATAGTSWATAVATLKAGIALCTGNAGDIIYVAQGHEEDVNNAAALDANIAGITIIGFGKGADQPEISFITDATAELTISAADVTIYNIRFLANYEITTAIQIAATGDGARLLNCEFWETSGSKEMLKMVNVAATANELVIADCRFIGGASADPTGAIFLGGAANKSVIERNDFLGTWSASVIDATTALSTGLTIRDNWITNLDAVAGKTIQVHASCGGIISGNTCYSAGAGFAIVGDAMFVAPDNIAMNTLNVETRNYETMFGPYRGDAAATASDSIHGDFVLAQTDLDAIIADITTAVDEPPTTNSLQDILHNDTGYSYDNTTDSLEALGEDTDAIIVSQTSITNSIAAMNDTGYVGTNSAASTTVPVVALLGGFGDDYFNTGWSMIIILDADGAGSSPEGEIRDIINYVSDTGTFTLNYALGAALASGDKVYVRRTEELNLDTPTILGGSGAVWYVSSITGSSGNVGDGSGTTWENAFATVTLADAAMAAGDICYIAAGHDEDVTTGTLVLDNAANMSFIGLGEGNARPLITCTDDGTALTINAAGITVKNIRLQAAVTACDVGIAVGASAVGCTLDNIAFIDGDTTTTDEFVIGINVDAAASNLTVKNCTYYSLDASNHVENWIDLSALTIDSPTITGCTVFGDFTEACIWGDSAVPVNCTITDNVLSNTTSGQLAIEFKGAATGILARNMLYSGAYGANGITILDPGSLKCIENYAVDAINETAMPIPFSQETSDITEVAAGSTLERLEWLQKQTDDVCSILGIDSTDNNVWYVRSGAAGSADGTSWIDAEVTLAAGINDATDSTGAYLFVASNHTEDLGTVAVNSHGMTIIGLGNGEARPIFVHDTNTDVLAFSVPNVTVKNCIFVPETQDATAAMSFATGADGATIENCVFRNATTSEFINTMTIDGGADDITIRGCKFYNLTAVGGHISDISSTNNPVDGLIIEDCDFYGTATTANINSTKIETDWIIRNNTIYNYSGSDLGIKFSTTANGIIANNIIYTPTWGSWYTPGSMQCFNNYVTNAINESGFLYPDAPMDVDSSVRGPGRVIYVDVGVTAGAGNTWATAWDTVNAAMDSTSADRGDIIYVAAGHTETLGAGTDGIDCDIAGVTIIGLGEGELRPLFDYDTTTDEFVIGADDIAIYNCQFKANAPTVDHAIDVETGAENFVISGCRFYNETQDTDYFDDIILVTANSDNGLIENCDFEQGAGTAQAAINTAGADFIHIMNNRFYGDYAVACIEDATTASVQITIQDNLLFNGTVGGKSGLNTVAAITLHADTTGSIIDNRVITNVAYPELSIVAAACFLSGNTYTEDPATSAGQVIGTRAGETYVSSMNADEVTDDLFDVTGGPIMIKNLMGILTATIGAVATDMEIVLDADAPYVDHDFSTSVTITDDVAGDRIVFDDTETEAVLTPCTGADGGAAGTMNGWFCGEGMIEQFCDANPNGALGAHITWYMVWTPLVDGAYVIAQPDP